MSQIHLDAISKQHQEILNQLKNINDLILVGGTALALQIGHRRSYDLDCFTETKIEDLQLNIQKVFQTSDIKQRLLSDNQYTFTINQISVTFFHDSPLLYSPVNWELIKLASIRDIFSSKLFVLGKRATWRDYVDIACLLKSKKVTLQQGIQDSTKRYKITQKWILEPLTYFKDITMAPIEWLGESMTDDSIIEYLIQQTKKYLKEFKL